MALSDDEQSPMVNHRSEISVSNPRQCSPSNKRPVEDSVDSPYVDCLPPVAKTAKCASAL